MIPAKLRRRFSIKKGTQLCVYERNGEIAIKPITDDSLKWVESEDWLLVDRLAAHDAPGFFNEIAKDQDRRRICGFSPLYSLIHLLNGSQGSNLHYGQAFTPETGSAVTFTSMIFE